MKTKQLRGKEVTIYNQDIIEGRATILTTTEVPPALDAISSGVKVWSVYGQVKFENSPDRHYLRWFQVFENAETGEINLH